MATTAVPFLSGSLINGEHSCSGSPVTDHVTLTLNPSNFTHPTKTVVLRVYYSWDGGLTYPEWADCTLAGVAGQVWGSGSKTTSAPAIYRGLPYNSLLGGYPNYHKCSVIILGAPTALSAIGLSATHEVQ